MCAQLVLLNLIELFWREGPSADMVLRPVMEVTCSEGLIDFIEGSRCRLPCPSDENRLRYGSMLTVTEGLGLRSVVRSQVKACELRVGGARGRGDLKSLKSLLTRYMKHNAILCRQHLIALPIHV